MWVTCQSGTMINLDHFAAIVTSEHFDGPVLNGRRTLSAVTISATTKEVCDDLARLEGSGNELLDQAKRFMTVLGGTIKQKEAYWDVAWSGIEQLKRP